VAKPPECRGARWAQPFGVISEQGKIRPDDATRLIADLSTAMSSRAHAELARHHLFGGSDSLELALGHARTATASADAEAMVEMCDQAGAAHLALGDYFAARRLLETVEEIDIAGEDRRCVYRLLTMAAATDGEGEVVTARHLLERAAALAERVGDKKLIVEAAVRHTLPTDWYAGDHRALVLLQKAEAFELTKEQTVRVIAARSLAEVRITVLPRDGQQVAWITRPGVARPLAHQALEINDTDLRRGLLEVMTPWISHVSVDGDG
jgi:hypothetical protein